MAVGGVKYGTKGKLEPWPSFVLALELVPVVACPGVNLRAQDGSESQGTLALDIICN